MLPVAVADALVRLVKLRCRGPACIGSRGAAPDSRAARHGTASSSRFAPALHQPFGVSSRRRTARNRLEGPASGANRRVSRDTRRPPQRDSPPAAGWPAPLIRISSLRYNRATTRAQKRATAHCSGIRPQPQRSAASSPIPPPRMEAGTNRNKTLWERAPAPAHAFLPRTCGLPFACEGDSDM